MNNCDVYRRVNPIGFKTQQFCYQGLCFKGKYRKNNMQEPEKSFADILKEKQQYKGENNMKVEARKTKVVLSLAGCIQVFKKCGIPESEYKKMNIEEIFSIAKELRDKHDLDIEEVFIVPEQ